MATLSALWESRFVAGACGIAMVLAISAAVLPYIALRSISTPLVIHFSDATGIDRVGSVWEIVEIGMLGIVIVAVNSAVVFELEKRKLIWAKFLALATLLLAALIFAGVLAIISVN